jgi:hypothetical protein
VTTTPPSLPLTVVTEPKPRKLLEGLLRRARSIRPISVARNRVSVPEREGEQSRPAQERVPQIVCLGDYTIAATWMSAGTGVGWRITTTDRSTSVQHEFFLNRGLVYHVQFQSSRPWSHHTPFVLGSRVKRIIPSEKEAILQCVAGL